MNSPTGHDATALKWPFRSLHQMLDQLDHLTDILELSRAGIGSMTQSHTITVLLNEIDRLGGEGHDRSVSQAQKVSELAEREVAEGFPLLHAQALVTAWTYLEAGIRRLVANWIENESSLLTRPPFERLSVRLAEYEALDQPDRSYYVVEALDRQVASGQRGVTRFESLLAVLGLSGEVPPRLRKRLFELGEVRNVIVHKASVVDKKLAESCPSLGYPVGSELRLDAQTVGMYFDAVTSYTLLIIMRVAGHFDFDASTEHQALLEKWR